jgi:hypothetical protein
MSRQRPLQNGNSGSERSTIFLQVGHRKLRARFFGIASPTELVYFSPSR